MADVPASAAAVETIDNAAASETDGRKLIVLEQLTRDHGFSPLRAEQAIAAVGPDVSVAVKYLVENDQGGSVVPKEDCPHVQRHVKMTPDGLPGLPQSAVCSYHQDNSNNAENSNNNDGADRSSSSNIKCPTGENWLCLECGVVRCSRYGKGHGVSHWKETKSSSTTAEVNYNNNNNRSEEEGHCIAASLADLSVWCYECDSYLRDPIVLDPILQKLELLKSEEAELEPRKKKPRPSYDNLVELEASERQEEAEEDSDDDDENNNNDDDTNTSNNNSNEDDDDDDNSDNSSVISPSIIEIAAAVARGVPIDFFQSDMDEEDIEYPFGSLPTSLEGIANFITSENCKSICILAGAGMSVAAGIPDFRSADGLYATMNPDLLTADPIEREAIRMDPTVALEQGMFLQNPFPCLELQREFILGTHSQRWKATLAHRFVELLHAKTGKLVRLYTQNIDGLEDQCTQLPKEKRIAVHGSMDRAECARCGEEHDYDDFCEKVQRQIKDLSRQDRSAPSESTPIECPTCGYNAVKPAIVLFRSSLPKEFFEKVPEDIMDVDLLIVMGTSLRVAPANSLVWRAPKKALRVLVNREPAGWHLGMQYGQDSKRDFFAPGDCDAVLLELMSHLGWLDDLQPLLMAEGKLPESSAALLRQKLGGGGVELEAGRREEL